MRLGHLVPETYSDLYIAASNLHISGGAPVGYLNLPSESRESVEDIVIESHQDVL